MGEGHSWQREQQEQRPGGRTVLGMLEKQQGVYGTGEEGVRVGSKS